MRKCNISWLESRQNSSKRWTGNTTCLKRPRWKRCCNFLQTRRFDFTDPDWFWNCMQLLIYHSESVFWQLNKKPIKDNTALIFIWRSLCFPEAVVVCCMFRDWCSFQLFKLTVEPQTIICTVTKYLTVVQRQNGCFHFFSCDSVQRESQL